MVYPSVLEQKYIPKGPGELPMKTEFRLEYIVHDVL